MKKIVTYLLLIIGTLCAYGQTSTLIISEDFQTWDPTEDTNPDTCSKGVVLEYGITRELTLTTNTGTVEIPVTLYKCGIAPECESRRIEDGGATDNLPGVTTGWVLLNKLDGYTIDNYLTSPDTIGEFIFGPISQIDSIRFAHSATGSERGIRIYTSTDGEIWERPTDDEFWDGADCQLGDVNSVEINMTDVYIKFTSGFKQSDLSSQFTRLHNIEVWGIPGEPPAGIETQKVESLRIYPVGEGMYHVDAGFTALNIYSTSGSLVYSETGNNRNIIDLSGLPKGIYIIQARDRSGQFFVTKIFRD